jgi:hypothetical protein
MTRVANLRIVSFSNPRSHRNPLQRLSDQRRSLALAGLALGAAFSAAIFRRKRRGGEAEFGPAVQFEENVPVVQPEPEPPVVQPEPGPPVAAEVPAPASEPELEEAPRPINAAPPAGRVGGAESSPAPAPAEPATGELSTEEASILSVLAQSGRGDDDRTAIAVATSLDRETGEVKDVLRKLDAEGVVSGDDHTPAGEEIWAVTERGVRRLGAQS